jgi:hypothetical protein
MWRISLQAAQILISQGLCSMELDDIITQYVNHYILTTEFFMNIKSDEQSLFKPSLRHACMHACKALLDRLA